VRFQTKYAFRLLLAGAVLCTILLFIRAALQRPAASRTSGTPAMITAAVQQQHLRLRDSCIRLLRTGDLLLRTGNDITSRMFCEFNRTDKTYSHGGLVIVEDGYPFVYHSIGGEDNPDERLRRDSAQFFLSPAHNLGLAVVRYRLPDSTIAGLTRVIRAYYSKRPLFDMDFDLETDDRLYCSEFVYKSLAAATGDTAFIPATSVFGHRFIGIDNLFINPHAVFVCELKYK